MKLMKNNFANDLLIKILILKILKPKFYMKILKNLKKVLCLQNDLL